MVHALPEGMMGCLAHTHYLLFIQFLCDTIFIDKLFSGIRYKLFI